MEQRFSRFSGLLAKWTGSPWATVSILSVIGVWLITGPLFHFSDTWQLLINTTTTILTNILVFIIQNTQNRSDAATHVKLDEILRVLNDARNSLIGLEERTEQEIETEKREVTRAAHAEATAYGQPEEQVADDKGGR